MTSPGRIGALAGGCALVLFASACSSGGEPVVVFPSVGPSSAAPSSAAPAATPTRLGGAGKPAGKPGAVRTGRQMTLGTTDSGGKSMLTVSSAGVLELTRTYSGRALFVATPLTAGGDEFMLRTAKILDGGESRCLRVHNPGAARPLQLKADPCDAADVGQIFTFPLSRDGRGRAIGVNGLVVHAEEGSPTVIVKKAGEGVFPSFTVTDKGKSTIPRLGD